MAPRIANDSFPDHYLTVDYDHGGAPMGIGGHPGDMGVDLAAADLGGDMGVAAAANADALADDAAEHVTSKSVTIIA